MDQLAKRAAELALQLAAPPAGGLRNDPQVLDAIEQLATLILKDVAAVRADKCRTIGETSGMWRIMQPIQRQ